MWWSALDCGYRAERKSRKRRDLDLSRRELAMTNTGKYAVFVLLLALCACKVGPNYQRPKLTVPDQYRGLAPDATTQQAGGGEQFGEMNGGPSSRTRHYRRSSKRRSPITTT